MAIDMKRSFLLLATAPMIITLGCPASVRAQATSEARTPYRVGAGDRLKVNVYNVEKLSGEYPVGGDGKIAVPILGRVPVSGLTLDDVAGLLTAQLGDGYFINPSVTVDIAAYRPVYVLGEVQRPGEYPFAEGMTVNRLVAAAGGFSYRANRKTMRVRREGGDKGKQGKITESESIMPGDTVYVGERYF